MDRILIYDNICLKVSFKDGKVTGIKITSQSKDAEEVTYDDLLSFRPNYSGLSTFDQKVLERVREIPYGRVTTYNEIAKGIGKDKAIRAVGNVLARNHFPIIVPCHRVIKADLRLGGFSLGKDLKRKILKSEGIKIEDNKVKAEIFTFC